MDPLHVAGWTLGAYLLGGIPFGLLLGKALLGVDIRERGSRNLGATNAARVLGRGRKGVTAAWFLLVFLLDAGKGFVPAFLAGYFEGAGRVLPASLFAALGAVAGLGLLLRRAGSPLLRKLSTPDDYLSVMATCGLLGLAAFPFPGLTSGAMLLGYAALVFLYLPLGKLRHAVFFFVARGDYGWRLGHRGVYPPVKAE